MSCQLGMLVSFAMGSSRTVFVLLNKRRKNTDGKSMVLFGQDMRAHERKV
jgi:hypothetical protein